MARLSESYFALRNCVLRIGSWSPDAMEFASGAGLQLGGASWLHGGTTLRVVFRVAKSCAAPTSSHNRASAAHIALLDTLTAGIDPGRSPFARLVATDQMIETYLQIGANQFSIAATD